MFCRNLGTFILFFLTLSCQPKRSKVELTPSINSSKPYPYSGSKPGVYSLSNERKTIDAQKLEVFRATLARTELGKLIVPKLSFGVDQQADYVEWKACPYRLEIPCLEGVTMNSEFYLGIVHPDQYTITLRACVNPENANSSENNCGSIYSLNWLQDKRYSLELESQIGELISKEHDIYALGETLYEVLKQFKKELEFCLETGRKTPIPSKQLAALISLEIDKQLENLLNLGPKFFVEHIGLVDPEGQDEELAAIVEPSLVIDDNSYTPKGLSLTQDPDRKEIITEYFADLDIKLANNYQIFPQMNLRELVQANSGIFPPSNLKNDAKTPQKFTRAEFFGLSKRKKFSAMGGALIQDNHFALNSDHQRESVGAAQMLRAMLWLEKPESSDCQAFDRVEKTLEKTRDQLQRLRVRILELKPLLVSSSP